MDSRKNFIAHNDGFVCDACGQIVPPARGTSRNHCPSCLTSKHVDSVVPGDRASDCHGLMPAVVVEGTDPDALDLVHRCLTCQKIIRNRMAPDDNRARLFALMSANR